MIPTVCRACLAPVKALLIVIPLLQTFTPLQAQEARPQLTAEEIVNRMVAMNGRRKEALRSYSSVRSYSAEYNGLKHLRAEMVVSVNYQWPNKKELLVVSESGSGTLRHRVLRPLLAAELKAMEAEQQRQTAISPENYSFELVDVLAGNSGSFYVLEVRPRHENKYLFRGRIWIEREGFAITRIVGEPAVNPSWWTKKIDFERSYQEIDGFWLPAAIESVTQVRIAGRARVTIEDRDYRLNDAPPFERKPNGLVVAASMGDGNAIDRRNR